MAACPISDSLLRTNWRRNEVALVDPKDSDYALTARELDADFVRTTDRHFTQMGLAVIGPELDLILRDYARATSIIVTVKLGSGYAVTFSVAAFIEMIRGAIDMLRKLPPRVKIILGIAVMAVILHPRSREKLIEWAKMLQERLRESKTCGALHFAEAGQVSG